MNHALISQLQQAFRQRSVSLIGSIEPLSSYHESGNAEEIEKGRELLSQGKVGCIVLAGGQGTRLGWEGPKGTFPLTRVRHKSLFQLICERRKAACKLYGAQLPLAIMTSPLNEEETKRHLDEIGCSVDLFCQEMAPFLDEQGEPIDLYGPCGNGDVLRHFYEAGLWKKWKEKGIEYVHLILVDNPLADPFDPNLCGFHALSGGDVTLKAILREKAEERVGVVGCVKGKLKVIEYFELPEQERMAMQGQKLKWQVAHIGLYCFSMEFVQRAQRIALPWHFAQKQAGGKQIFKCERFIFDLLDEAKAPRALVYPREETYAPLKNAKGENSPETVRAQLLEADRRQFSRISGLQLQGDYELDPAFYYPNAELMRKWSKRLPDAPYIESV